MVYSRRAALLGFICKTFIPTMKWGKGREKREREREWEGEGKGKGKGKRKEGGKELISWSLLTDCNFEKHPLPKKIIIIFIVMMFYGEFFFFFF